jgi:hypothetical protein
MAKAPIPTKKNSVNKDKKQENILSHHKKSIKKE